MRKESRSHAARACLHGAGGDARAAAQSATLAALLILGVAGLAPDAPGQLPPANDNFANAGLLTGTNARTLVSNLYATKEPGEPDHAGNPGGRSLWWRWQAPQTGYVTLTTQGSSIYEYAGPLDTLLAVYTGPTLTNLSLVVSNDDGPIDVTSLASFKAFGGTVYWIAVDGYSDGPPEDAAAGTVGLSLQFTPNLPAAPPWSLPDINGATISSTDFAGQVVVLNFWLTSCGSCLAEAPNLAALQQKYARDGLTVVGISVDDSPDGVNPPAQLVGATAAGLGMNYPIVMTRPNGTGVEALYGGMAFVPQTFIIDRQNQMVQTLVDTQTFEVLENAVVPLLYADLPLKLSLVNGLARISWPATQATFVVESSSTAANGVWTAETATIQTDGVNQFTDLPLGQTAKFYRIRH